MLSNIRATLVVATAIASACTAATYPTTEKLVVFGGSLEDNGSTPHKLSTPAYWQGRFTNSYVWPEYTAKILGLALSDNAYAAATSNNTFVRAKGKSGPVPSIADAVQDYLKAHTNETADQRSKDTVLVAVSGNDFYNSVGSFARGTFTPTTFAQSLTSHIYDTVGVLLSAGYRRIYVSNTRPLGIMPFATRAGITMLATSVEYATVKAHEGALANLKKQYGLVANNVSVFDFATAMRVATSPQVLDAMNISNPTTECVSYDLLARPIFCSNPSTHLFYDCFHPSGRPHYLMGVVLANKIRDPSYEFTVKNYLAAIEQYKIGSSNATSSIIANAIS
ncbi:hypothetical protein GGI12_003341 [Dipsacomyces acuminosporus]|nr:hypothetical protein GGI12_003341 [Dipsacomyces acuminosporus]